MSAATKLPVRMTVREFLDWEPGDHRRYELVDGVPRAMAPASMTHAVLQSELGALIRNHLRAHRPGCRVATNPGVVPHLLSAHNARVPDLGVTCSPVTRGQTVMQDPVLLIEILSSSNQGETWSNVWTYTSIPTVQEILVLHSTRVAGEILRRSSDGRWPDSPELLTEGELVLGSIGFRAPLSEIYAGADLSD